HTFTGASMGAITWLPPRMLLRPEVMFFPASLLPLFLTFAPPTHPEVASPTTATELPHTFTGASSGTLSWLPPRMLLSPLVRLLLEPLPPLSRTVAPPLQPASELPIKETALPQAFTGRSI